MEREREGEETSITTPKIFKHVPKISENVITSHRRRNHSTFCLCSIIALFVIKKKGYTTRMIFNEEEEKEKNGNH